MQATIPAILAALDAAETIIIHRHVNPDPDAIGSQTGLAAALKAAYPAKHIYAVGEPAPRLAWIASQDTIDPAEYQHAVVVVIDTANAPRVAGANWQTAQQVIKIDHHPDREPFGDLSFVNTEASSSSEIIADMIKASDQLQLDQTVAARLYAGIIGDTGRFLYDLTKAHTHEVVADLMRTGIDAPAIGRAEEEISPQIAKLQAYALGNLQVSANGAGSLIITQKVIGEFGLAQDEAQAAVSTVGQLTTVRSWVVFTERPDGQFRVELRGKQWPINPIAVAHGGGGHPLASGAVAKNLDECNQIIEELDQLNGEQLH